MSIDSSNASNLLLFKRKKEKFSGGRYLEAIWCNQELTTNQRVVLQCVASFINFKGTFENRWCYLALSMFEKRTGLNKATIVRIINGHTLKEKVKSTGVMKETHYPGLIELGYMKKQIASKEKQARHEASDYCLTEKVFLSFVEEKEISELQPATPPVAACDSAELQPATQDPSEDPPQDPSFFSDPPNPPSAPDKKRGQSSRARSLIKVQAMQLTNFLRPRTKEQFFNFHEAVEIIEEVLEDLNITISSFSQTFKDLREWTALDSFIPPQNLNPDTVKSKFIEWNTKKDDIKQRHADKRKPKIVQVEVETAKMSQEEIAEMFRKIKS